MSIIDARQLRISATETAVEEIARGHGDDDIDEAILWHLLTYGPDELTLGELREIAAAATAAAKGAAT